MHRQASVRRALCAFGVAFLTVSCGGNGGALAPAGISPTQFANLESIRPAASGKIKHVVIIVQENRTFDNLFYGFPGADTKKYGYTSTGTKVALQPIPLEITWDIEHDSYAVVAACNGKGSIPATKCRMNGFDKEYVQCGHGSYPPCPNLHPQYGYVPHAETAPYFQMAKQYVLADRMFTSHFDGSSFVSHQYIIAGQSSSAINYPTTTWGCDGGPDDRMKTVTQSPPRQPGPYTRPCFDNQTLGDELDAAGLSWGFYTATLDGDGNEWSPYQAIKHIRYGPDWRKDVITPQTKFIKDAGSSLRTVSWVTPTCENSDHAGCGSNTGPSWVTSLVNAVGESKYWNSSAIFIMWDDYGGWYDHLGPAYLDYDGLGMRVPLLIISPYAKQHYVSHVHYEHGSILRFIEDQFGLPRLAASDSRATSPGQDCFDFSQPPRKFVPIEASLDTQFILHQPPDRRIPDSQ